MKKLRKQTLKKYKKFIVKYANFKQVVSLIFWLIFDFRKWDVFTQEVDKGKTFKAAFEIAKEKYSNKVTVRYAYENKLPFIYKGQKIIDIEFHEYGYGPINWFNPNPPFCYRIVYFDKKGNEKKVMQAEYEKVKLIRK